LLKSNDNYVPALPRISAGGVQPAGANENLVDDSHASQTATDPDFNLVLAEMESLNIFYGPKADFLNRVLASSECEVRRTLPKAQPERRAYCRASASLRI
jgi:hypothetical protein